MTCAKGEPNIASEAHLLGVTTSAFSHNMIIATSEAFIAQSLIN